VGHPGASLTSLTYLSTATERFGPGELRDLLAHSRERNHERGLTGLLLHVDGRFIQTLEGETATVDATYERIAADPRHRDVFVTWREEVDHRAYPDWSMGFEDLDAEEAARLPGFSDFLAATPGSGATDHLGSSGVFHRIFRDRMR
jgi:hypothetical protein